MTAASTTSASHHPTQTGNGREARPQPADMTAAAERREQFAAGLRELADFLLAHPDVPLPDAELLAVAIGDDEKCMADIRATAAGLGVEVSYLNGDTQYPQAVRQFGAIRYMRRASLSQAMARYDALMSYRGLVQPEPAEAGVR